MYITAMEPVPLKTYEHLNIEIGKNCLPGKELFASLSIVTVSTPLPNPNNPASVSISS